MKIVTLVKYVPDASGERSFADDGTVERDDDGLLSELDEYAVEQALQISEAGDDVEVVALTLGPDDASDAIKRALQMGADSGVHVLDDAVPGSDALATSAVLAAAIRKAEPDLVICGMASTDGSMGVIPAMVAERLGWPALTFAHSLEVAGDSVTIERDSDVSRQTISAQLPAIVSVTDQSGDARYPSAKGIMGAKKKPVEEWELSDLEEFDTPTGLAAALTSVTNIVARPAKGAGKIVTDDGTSGAAAIVEFLAAGRHL